MKISEMNATQKKAFRKINDIANEIVTGLELSIDDGEDEEECERMLNDHEGLVQSVYTATVDVIGAKEIRFCGMEWLLNECDSRITKLGY